jgi:L-ascorbate metabolism protein UlaG (beta-lactamase superfamily)
MDITYLGHSSFKLRGKSTTVVTDPYRTDAIGLKFPKHIEADIVTVSHGHDDHNAVSQIEGSPYVIAGPGEYEVKGVGIVGIPSFHDNEKGAKRGKNIIYRIEIDGLSIVHMGDLGHSLSSAEVESLGEVDILLIPVGGAFTIDSETAVTVVKEIDPSIVVPMHFNRPELDQKVFGSLQQITAFLKEMGKDDTVPVPKLVITKDKLPEELQVVVLA